jgi:hypothetical protein
MIWTINYMHDLFSIGCEIRHDVPMQCQNIKTLINIVWATLLQSGGIVAKRKPALIFLAHKPLSILAEHSLLQSSLLQGNITTLQLTQDELFKEFIFSDYNALLPKMNTDIALHWIPFSCLWKLIGTESTDNSFF